MIRALGTFGPCLAIIGAALAMPMAIHSSHILGMLIMGCVYGLLSVVVAAPLSRGMVFFLNHALIRTAFGIGLLIPYFGKTEHLAQPWVALAAGTACGFGCFLAWMAGFLPARD